MIYALACCCAGFVHGKGIAESVNYTLNMVGGAHGGPVDNSSWNKSFHGDQEIVADKYQLCARHIEPKPIMPTYQWVNFTNCLNGYKGIAICTYYFPDQIQDNAKICAEATGVDWSALDECATGDVGNDLYKASVFYTSDQIARKIIPPYGTGKDQGIPIIRIAGVTYKGTIDAFNGLGDKICKAAGKSPLECGCFRHETPPSA